jgi:integrase
MLIGVGRLAYESLQRYQSSPSDSTSTQEFRHRLDLPIRGNLDLTVSPPDGLKEYWPLMVVREDYLNQTREEALAAIEGSPLSALANRSHSKACAEMPNGLLFEFALLSGMRPEEYLALQWRDLNFDKNTAQVRRALVRHKKTWRFQEPKTKGSKRLVTVPASLCRKLEAHKRSQSELRLKIGNEWQAHDLVFCSEFGTPLSIPNLTYSYFRPILTKAGLPQIRLYDLRHSHATLLLAALYRTGT